MDVITKYNINIEEITLDEADRLYKYIYSRDWRSRHMKDFVPKRGRGRPRQYSEEEMKERLRQKKAEYKQRMKATEQKNGF